MDERKLRDALKACLSGCEFPVERQQAVLHAIRKEEMVVKRKISVALVFALVMILAIGGTAIAASLGVFGQSAGERVNEQSAERLERLEDAAQTYDDTQAAQASSAAAEREIQSTYEEILANLYERRFNLTLNQAYFDGYKLYYSYTLTTNSPLAWYSGEGAPTGFDSWYMQEEGKYVEHYMNSVEENQKRFVSFFAAHPVGYIGKENMAVGDGAAMNGTPLTILDSGEVYTDDHTIQGFQEVEMPEGFAPDGDIEIELSILYGASLCYQDEENVYWGHVVTPENRGILRLPFTVAMDGQTETYAGSVKTSAYSAAASVRVSDVDISGEVVFDAPEWAAAFEANMQAGMNGEHAGVKPYITGYVLVADGVEYPNLDGAYGVNADGNFVVGIRYDLPKSVTGMTLRPTSSGLDCTQETVRYENEEIVLMK